jgi:galactonate dehydratase
MHDVPVIDHIEVHTARVSAKTDWTFLTVNCSDGITGCGEATLNGSGGALKSMAQALAIRLRGLPAQPNQVLNLQRALRAGLVEAAVHSAVEQALWDAQGQRYGVPVHALLGGALRERVPLYANINRGIETRSADGFALAAQQAVARGFSFIKIAPFDGLDRHQPLEVDRRFHEGLERIKAVCDATVGRAEVMVDCHWRLDEVLAARLLEHAARLSLLWVECPMPEEPEYLPMLRRIRAKANDCGVRLAGMEKGMNLSTFAQFIREGIYDVLMPDVKYSGGLLPTQQIAAQAREHGILIAPHNPTGPICHAASIQVSATIPNLMFLEYQLDETPHFDALVEEPIMQSDGMAAVPMEPGLGVQLSSDSLAKVEVQ